MAGWGVTETRMIRGSPVKVRALPDRAKHVEVKVKKCEVGGARAEFDYPVGVLCASDRSEWMMLFTQSQDLLQGDHSACSKPPVDIDLKVAF